MNAKDIEVIPRISPQTLRIDEIRYGDQGLIEAKEAERSAIVGLLALGELSRLDLSYSLHRQGQGRIGLKGRLTAKLTQTCVVSLEPLPQELDVPIEVAFWPVSQIRDMEKAAAEEPTSQGILDWPESIVDGKIDLGPVLYESLATALDPYPRAKDVAFAWASQGESAAEEETPAVTGPFAALARLKQP